VPAARNAEASRRTAPWLAAAGLAAATAAVDVMDPAHRHVPLCPFHAVTGWWCPLCGGLRAAQALSHADLTTALHDNVLVVAAVPVLLWFGLDRVLRSGSSRPAAVRSRGVGTAVVILLTAFAIARNLPWLAMLRP
jgi:Protein of unknown function (DUF2752)